MASLSYYWFTNFIHASNNISLFAVKWRCFMQVLGYLLHNSVLLEMCLCAAVWEFPAFRRLLVPPCSGSNSIILWNSITLLNTWICSNTTVRTSVWSCFASKFQQYAVFQTYIQNSHTCWLFDHLWPPSHLSRKLRCWSMHSNEASSM